MRLTAYWTVVVLLLLTGCVKHQPIAELATIKPTEPGARGFDVFAARRDAGEKIPMLKGIDVLTIRTYHHVPPKRRKGRFERKEMVGAQCAIISEGFHATVKTPGQVRVPDYGKASRKATVECKKDGYRSGIKAVAVYDVDKAGRRAAGANNGLLGLVVVEVINAADNDDDNEFDYQVAEVYMNRIGCETTKQGCRSE